MRGFRIIFIIALVFFIFFIILSVVALIVLAAMAADDDDTGIETLHSNNSAKAKDILSQVSLVKTIIKLTVSPAVVFYFFICVNSLYHKIKENRTPQLGDNIFMKRSAALV